MNTPSIHTAPRWRVVAKEQLRVAEEHTRLLSLLLVVVFALIAGTFVRMGYVAAHQSPRVGITNMTYIPQMTGMLLILPLILPLVIWQDEDPRRRAYHRAMPMSQPLHALTKVFAGWVWLMVSMCAFVAFMLILRVMMQRATGNAQNYVPGFVWWEWLVPFTSVTIAYLLASSAAVGTRQPFVWIFGMPLVYPGIAMLFENAGMRQVAHQMSRLISGYYGVTTAVVGNITWPQGPQHLPLPSLERWLLATLVWGTAGGVLLYVIARRRTEAS